MFFLQIQLLNTQQDDKTELRAELDKIRANKPKNMPTTMMRIHEIHNKLNREADSEKARMDLVIQLTRTDIFDIIRSHYPFLYSQIVEKENTIRTRYRKEQRISKLLTGDTQAKRGVEYHLFNTLFQLTCKFLRSHEPLTVTVSYTHLTLPTIYSV